MNLGDVYFILILFGLESTVVPIWRIFKKAGLNPYWTLCALIPLFGHLLVLCKLAFSRWPQIE